MIPFVAVVPEGAMVAAPFNVSVPLRDAVILPDVVNGISVPKESCCAEVRDEATAVVSMHSIPNKQQRVKKRGTVNPLIINGDVVCASVGPFFLISTHNKVRAHV